MPMCFSCKGLFTIEAVGKIVFPKHECAECTMKFFISILGYNHLRNLKKFWDTLERLYFIYVPTRAGYFSLLQ